MYYCLIRRREDSKDSEAEIERKGSIFRRRGAMERGLRRSLLTGSASGSVAALHAG